MFCGTQIFYPVSDRKSAWVMAQRILFISISEKLSFKEIRKLSDLKIYLLNLGQDGYVIFKFGTDIMFDSCRIAPICLPL